MDERAHSVVDTKDRILDAAERLFAANGFRGTSIKQLAREARVNQAAMNYHFGSKAALIEQVIERRMGPVSRVSRKRLAAVRQDAARQGLRPLARNVLRAFIEPAFTLISPLTKKKCFMALAGRSLFDSDTTIRLIFERQFQPTFKLLSDVMHEALPQLPPAILHRRLHFASGAMAHCMKIYSAGFPIPGLYSSMDDLDAVMTSLLTFITSGVCAPVQEGSGHEHP